MAKQETISLNIKEGGDKKTKHYNLDGIAYFRATNWSFRLHILLLVALPTVVGLGVSGLIGEPWAIVIGITVSGVLLFWFREPDRVEIGTLTSTDFLKTSNVKSLEASFLEYADEPLTVEGSTNTLVHTHDYVYHFFPKNIVSIKRTHNKPGFLAQFVLVLFALVLLPAPLLTFSSGVGSESNPLPIIVSFILIVTFLILLYYLIFNRREVIAINLQGGKTEKFHIDPSDIDYLEKEFVG